MNAKFLFLTLILIMLIPSNVTGNSFASAEEVENSTTQQLADTVSENLSEIDFSQFDDILFALDEEETLIFGSESFFEKINN